MHAAALAYFRETARLGSIRKAASRLNVAASAVNRHILKLEDEFGTQLFDRFSSGMRLTAAGELLLRHITTTLHDYDRLRAEIDDIRGARSGQVSIVAVDSLLVDFLPRALDRFRVSFPAVTFSVMAVSPTEVPQLVASGEAEIGFTFVGQMPRSVHFVAEVSAPIGVVMPSDHPLARKRAVKFAECAAFPFLAQAGPLPRSADIDPAFARFREGLKPRLTSNSIQLVKRAIRLGMGLAYFTRLGFLEEIAHGELSWRPFASPAINALKIGLLTATDRPLGGPAYQLSKQLAHDLEELRQA
jgi:DNA-binding transcriptional LysR family regulator